ncbi:MAG: YqjD family protein [Rhizobacter sp.]
MNATTTSPNTAPGANGPEGLRNNLRHIVDEADQFLNSAVQTGDQKFDAMRDKFVAQVRQMRAQLDEMEDSAMYRARRAARAADQAVQSHPYGAMGIATAAGLLLGFLAARR